MHGNHPAIPCRVPLPCSQCFNLAISRRVPLHLHFLNNHECHSPALPQPLCAACATRSRRTVWWRGAATPSAAPASWRTWTAPCARWVVVGGWLWVVVGGGWVGGWGEGNGSPGELTAPVCVYVRVYEGESETHMKRCHMWGAPHPAHAHGNPPCTPTGILCNAHHPEPASCSPSPSPATRH